MYKFTILMAIIIAIISGCSQKTNSTTNIPSGVSPTFYNQAVEIVNILEKHMNKVDELTKQEQQVIDRFFTTKPATPQESDIQGHLNILEASRTINLNSANDKNTDGRITSVKIYTEELEKLKKSLNM